MHAKGEIDAVLWVAAVDMPPAFNDGLKQGLRSGRVDRQMLMAIHCQQAGVGKLIFNPSLSSSARILLTAGMERPVS